MLLSTKEARSVSIALLHSEEVSATSVINFNSHKKGRIEVRHTMGFGITVTGFSGQSPLPFGRESYTDRLAFNQAYNI